MKNIIIGGSCRAGKSLLAKHIMHNFDCFSYFSTDHIRTALMFCQPNKNFDKEDFEEYRKFVYKLYECNLRYNKIGMFMIWEGNHFSIDEFLKLYNDGNTIAVFVGKPQLNESELFNEIRENEKTFGSWTSKHTDDELKNFVLSYHKKNIEEREKVKQLNLPNIFYLDTSVNQMEQITKFVKFLKKELSN